MAKLYLGSTEIKQLYQGSTDIGSFCQGNDIAYFAKSQISANTIYDSNGNPHLDIEVVDNGTYDFYSAYDRNADVSGNLNFQSLTTITTPNLFRAAFQRNTHITSISYPNVTGVNVNNVFQQLIFDSTSITSVSFPKLETINGSSVFKSAFSKTTNLISITFPSLWWINGDNVFYEAFAYCNNLESVYFPAFRSYTFGDTYKTQFSNMMYFLTNEKIHTLHFPSNVQSAVSNINGYPLFGGRSGSVVLAFDLPATS